MKRFLSAALSVAMLAGIITANAEEDYINRGEVCEILLAASDDYNPGIEKKDILQGYEDGKLHEERSVTRAEALVMLKRAFGTIPQAGYTNKLLRIPAENFDDIPPWAVSELTPLFNAGIVAGVEDGIFAPDDRVTRKQLQLFINRMYRLFGTNLRDDFYGTVNKEYLDSVELPSGHMEYGTLMDDDSSARVRDLIREIAASNPAAGSKEEKLKNLYDNYLDMGVRNKSGAEPLREYLDLVDSVKKVSDFAALEFDEESLLSIFGTFTVGADIVDSSRYAAYFTPISTYDKQFFADPEFERSLTDYYTVLGTLAGESQANAKKEAELFVKFERILSQEALTLADRRDISGMYNVYTLQELDDMYKTVDLRAVYDDTGLKNENYIVVPDEDSVKLMANMLTDEYLDTLKAAAKLKVLDSYSKYLSADFVKANDEFTAALYGAEGDSDQEYSAVNELTLYFADYVGELYADKYNTEKMISDVSEMTDEIVEVYREKISSCSWMSDAAKQKALKKLDTLQIKIGAPAEWDSYMDEAVILSAKDGGSLVDNILNANSAVVEHMYSLEGTEVDKTDWVMYPYEANACYYASNNDITIPTAILQTAVYDESYKYEANFGGIGTIIAHEITHAFDASGSQFDENGNLNNWWTDADKAGFDRLCSEVTNYYDGLEGAPDIPLSADITLTENMADLGAMEIITAAADKHENFDYTIMYEMYSFVWFATMSRQTAQYLAINDTHSFPAVRVNRVLQSCDRFYEVYAVTERDGMYIPPEQRVQIWR